MITKTNIEQFLSTASNFPETPTLMLQGLPPKSHLSPGKMPQTLDEALVFDRLTIPRQAIVGVTRAIHLGESNVPRWVSIQLQERSEDQEKIGF